MATRRTHNQMLQIMKTDFILYCSCVFLEVFLLVSVTQNETIYFDRPREDFSDDLFEIFTELCNRTIERLRLRNSEYHTPSC